jgi:hypothetical protein
VGLQNVTIKLKLENQFIEGTFRGLIQSSTVDILLLGNKKSSLLLLFTETDIQSIIIKHTDGLSSFGHSTSKKSISTILLNKQKILTEVYEPLNKQEAYSILTGIYAKYRGSKVTINTENFDNVSTGYQYSIIEEEGNHVIPFEIDRTGSNIIDRTNNNVNANYINANQYINKNRANLKPRVITEGTLDFMTKILGGHKYERNYWESGYSGQLVDSS